MLSKGPEVAKVKAGPVKEEPWAEIVVVADPPPEQVLVATRPEAVTERHPPVPAREVIERFVVVAWPVMVVEAREVRPPDWVREFLRVVPPATVRVEVTFRVPPMRPLPAKRNAPEDAT